jgi:DNA-binding transcriptional LysR family regulator
LGFLPDFAETWLPDSLGRFARAHPGVQVEARVDRSSTLLEAIGRGELDLALTWNEGGNAAVNAEDLAWLPMVWVGRQDFARRADEPLPLVLLEQPCLFRRRCLEALDIAGISWRLVFTSPSLPGIWAAVAAGLGITLRTLLGIPEQAVLLKPEATGLPSIGEVGLRLCASDGSSASPAATYFCSILRESCLSNVAGGTASPNLPE